MRRLTLLDRLRGYHNRGGLRVLNCCSRRVIFGEVHTCGA